MKLKRNYSILSITERIHPHPDYHGKGITIAFIDSGFFPHPELDKRIIKIVDVTKEKLEQKDFNSVRDSSWHGTMVACAAAGTGKWSDGHYRGIAYQSKLVLIKAFDGKKIKSINIQKALEWVLENHKEYDIKIVNLSLGGDRNEPASVSKLCRIINKLTKQNVVVVAAAGNSANKPIVPPASCPDAITVGGIDDHNSRNENDFTEYGSTYGYTLEGHLKPEIVAPARQLPAPMVPENTLYDEMMILHELLQVSPKNLKQALTKKIKQTKLDKKLTKDSIEDIIAAIKQRLQVEKSFSPQYQHVDGTSFAAPIVSSVVAQMLEANPRLTPTLVKMILETTARRISVIVPEKQGYGCIQARACVERAIVETELLEFEVTPKLMNDRVIFYYRNPDAKKVTLIGDFTAWQKDIIIMKTIDHGIWRADIPRLSKGYYHYKFLVDDKIWIEIPLNPLKENDNHNGLNSVLWVK